MNDLPKHLRDGADEIEADRYMPLWAALLMRRAADLIEELEDDLRTRV